MPASTHPLAHALGIDPNDRDTRALAGCIVASLVLHAGVLLLFPDLREGRPAAAPPMVLSARIAPRSEFPERPEPKPETRPALPPSPVEAPRPVLTAPATAPAAPRIAEPAPVPTPPPVQATPQVQPAPAQQPAAPAAPAPPRAAEGPALAAQSEGFDQGSLARYRAEVILTMNRTKRPYPAMARERGWKGTAEVRVEVAPTGMTRSVSLKTSSGYQLLDDYALDMVRNGRNRVAIPPALRGHEFSFDVPVIFDLTSG